MFKGRFSTFSLFAFDYEWISLSLKMVFGPWWTSSLLTQFAQIWCNEHCQWQHMQWWWLFGKDTIICWTSIKQYLHSPCYWDVWVFSFAFWFISDRLCIDHYRASSVVLFSPLDACFYCRHHVSVTLQCAQAISILQLVIALGKGSSSLPHIITSGSPSLANLWWQLFCLRSSLSLLIIIS